MNQVSISVNQLMRYSQLQFRSTAFIGYSVSRKDSSVLRFLRARGKSKEFRSKAYSGMFAGSARKRCLRCSEIFALLAPKRKVLNPFSQKMMDFNLAFLTLTIPDSISEDEEKKVSRSVLKPFIQVLQRRYQIKNFVWKAERGSNGLLHYHMIIDEPIHMDHIRNHWNRYLRKARLLDQFALEHGHFNAPSTEIKAARNPKQAASYVSKYIAKSEGSSRRIFGRIWDASLKLKQVKWPVFDCPNDFWTVMAGVYDADKMKSRFEDYWCSIRPHEFECDSFYWSRIRTLCERWKVQSSVFLEYLETSFVEDLRVEHSIPDPGSVLVPSQFSLNF